MTSHPPIQFRGIAYELGQSEPIAEIAELRDDPSTLELMLTLGLDHYLRSELPPLELARRSLSKTLTTANVAPEDVDLLIYVSESFPANTQISQALGETCASLGLINAYPIGLCLSTCGNMGAAFKVAASALIAGSARTVAILASDVVQPGQSRIMPPAVTVFSDAASSCIVSMDDKGGYTILGQALNANNSIWGGGALDLIKDLGSGIHAACADAFRIAGKTQGECRGMLLNNYNFSVQRLFALSGGFRKDQLFLANTGRFAHMGTSDILINLHHYSSERTPVKGDILCLLSTGPSMCGTLVLEHP